MQASDFQYSHMSDVEFVRTERAKITPKDVDGWGTVEVDDVKSVTWKNTLNSNHARWGHMWAAQSAALNAGYPYFTWSGRVFHTVNGYYTGVLEEAL